jgi:hypothetical protein
MGRTRQYATATERQAAYRQRVKATTAWVDRASFDRMEAALAVLHDATWRALHHGHPLATAIYHSHPLETLEATVAWIVSHYQQDTRHTADAPPDVLPPCSEANPPLNQSR